MKKTVLIVLGAVITVVSLGVLVAGGALFSLVGSDGYIDSGTHPINSQTRGIISQTTRITHEASSAGRLGDFRIRVRATSTDGKPVFIGVAKMKAVTQYFQDVDHDVVRQLQFDPFRIRQVRREGLAVPPPPANQPFWNAKVSGTGQVTLDWKVKDGQWRFVIMNADGSPNVRISGLLGVKVPFARPLAIILLVAGLLGLVVGVLLFVLGIRTKSQPRPRVDEGVGAPEDTFVATPGAGAVAAPEPARAPPASPPPATPPPSPSPPAST